MCDAAKAQQNHTDELRRLHGRVKELDVHCERLRLVAEGSHDGLWDWPDVNVDRQWWSPRFLELLGYAGDAFEPTLEQFFDLLHPDDRERCRVEVSARLTEDEPFETEYRLRTASGAYRWFCARGRTFRDAAGNPVRMAGSVRDITDSKVLEMALRASEEKYRGIFDESVAAIYVFDARKRFVDSNQAGLDLLGYSREELLSMSIPDVDADPTVVLPAHARLLSGGTLVRYEHQLKRKDGRIITVLNNSRPLSDAQGNVVGMQSTLIDITKRKKAEEALRKSEETFRGFVENANDVVHSLSLDGRFIYVTPKATELLGYKVEEVLGEPYSALVHPDDLARCDAFFREVISTGERRGGVEYRVRHKDGSWRWHTSNASVLKDADGNVVSYVGISRDITDRKRAEGERLAHVHFLEGLDQINRVIQGTDDVEQMMSEVLDAVLTTLDCDRAYFVYPCDPEAATWRAPMERTRPDYPGAAERGIEYPVTPSVADAFRAVLTSPGPVAYGQEGAPPIPDVPRNQFGVRAQLAMAVCPKGHKPYMVGVHQCSRDRVWTAEEMGLFEAIGRRLSDALAVTLNYRKMRNSEQRYRVLFERNMASVYRTTLDGRILECNEAMVTMLGYDSQDDLLSRSSWELYFERSDRTEFIERLRREGGLTNAEYRMRRKDGTSIYVIENVSLLPDDQGTPAIIQGTMIDITERKRAEERLLTSERKLSNAMKIARLGYWEFDVETGLFTFDDHFYAIFRTSAAEVGGYTMSPQEYAERFLPPEDRPLVAEEMRKAMEAVDPDFSRYLEHRIRYADGETGYVAVRYFLVKDEQGRTIKTYGANQDITERKRVEEELARHRDRLEELVRERTRELEAAQAELLVKERLATLGRLTATVSHELRNPLGTVRTSFFSIAEEVRDLGLDLDDVLERAERNIVRCDSIIEELLDYTRSKRPETVPTRIDEWLAGVLDEQDIGADVSVTRALASDAEIAIDRERLRRAVVNLVTNACQAMQNIEDTERQLAVETAVRNGRLEISVTDTGHGIPPEQMQKVFEPLYSTKGFGVGLGLPTVMQIMKMHGGGIEMESEPGVGTRAVLWLPLASTEGVRDERTAHSGSGRQR